MSSNIDTSKIDRDFPTAGSNNPTEGFRDNFEKIADNLDITKIELEDLQENVARTDKTVNFNSNILFNADLIGVTESVLQNGNVLVDTQINFANGHYQTITAGRDIKLDLTGWPDAGRLAKITVALLSDGLQRNITFGTNGVGTIKKSADYPSTLTISSDVDPVVIEFWTIDAGETVFGNYVGQFV